MSTRIFIICEFVVLHSIRNVRIINKLIDFEFAFAFAFAFDLVGELRNRLRE